MTPRRGIRGKHLWQLDPSFGEIDWFVVDVGYHNGPRCIKCSLQFCKHCRPELLNSKCPY